MKIYTLGNLLIKEDSLPLKILPKLKKLFPLIDFVAVDPNENFPPEDEKDLIILDTVKGIKKPMVLDFINLKSIKTTPISPHDYDLMIHLQLLLKLKKIDSVKIIGLPFNTSLNAIASKLVQIISTLPSKNAQRKTCKGQKHELISQFRQ